MTKAERVRLKRVDADLRLVLADLTQAKELLAFADGVGCYELLVETLPKLGAAILHLEGRS